MIASMTGFGRGQAARDGFSATVELRSVNNRYLDVSVRLPRIAASYEPEILAALRQAFSRGRITVQVDLKLSPETGLLPRLNLEVARQYLTQLETLRAETGLPSPIRLEHLLTLPDLFERPELPEADDRIRQVLMAALTQAIKALQATRHREGALLQADLEARLKAIAHRLEAIEARAPQRLAEAREKLRARVQELLREDQLDSDRLEQEIVLLADRLDITEECVRLRAHLQHFHEALQSEEPSGRRLNFLAQELHREANTINAKANDATIALLAVEIKEEIEKIREQIQNIE
ncbi:MAG: YicC/YloC family endoribonuclease [Rhodothermus sp.]|nr:YicC/YloC family endoribonuclease [Rhodothermus sp.]